MTATMEECKSTSLYYREGSSDKEYHVRLEAKGNGFVVNISPESDRRRAVEYRDSFHRPHRFNPVRQHSGASGIRRARAILLDDLRAAGAAFF